MIIDSIQFEMICYCLISIALVVVGGWFMPSVDNDD